MKTRAFRILWFVAGVAGLILAANAQDTKNQRPPIIDMHLQGAHPSHALNRWHEFSGAVVFLIVVGVFRS